MTTNVKKKKGGISFKISALSSQSLTFYTLPVFVLTSHSEYVSLNNKYVYKLNISGTKLYAQYKRLM